MPPFITVWRIPLDACDTGIAQLQMLLSEKENCKAAQFKSDIHRRRYVVRHAAMRQILARETECAPHELHVVSSRFDKPSLERPFEHVQFNLTHSEDVALLAICTGGAPIGVDVEAQRPLVDLDRLVAEVCSPAEAQQVLAGADDEQMFYRCWVGKEAVLKCIGIGLNVSTKAVGVLDAQGHLMSTPVLPIDWASAGAIQLRLLDELPPGFVGALAVLHKGESGAELKVCMRDWTP